SRITLFFDTQLTGCRHSRAGGNPALSVQKLIGKTVSLDFTFWIPAFAGMTNFRFLFLVFCPCGNDGM
ncbi:TPA: hypothetical protein ACV5EK_002104, partial [Neisseria meningitidis]